MIIQYLKDNIDFYYIIFRAIFKNLFSYSLVHSIPPDAATIIKIINKMQQLHTIEIIHDEKQRPKNFPILKFSLLFLLLLF